MSWMAKFHLLGGGPRRDWYPGECACLRTALAFIWTIGMRAGKTGVGKSSTVNSILAESAAQVVSMQAPASRAQAYARQAGGFTLTLIDTPGILEGDAVDGQVRTAVVSVLRQASVSLKMCHAGWIACLLIPMDSPLQGLQEALMRDGCTPPLSACL